MRHQPLLMQYRTFTSFPRGTTYITEKLGPGDALRFTLVTVRAAFALACAADKHSPNVAATMTNGFTVLLLRK